MTKAIRLKTKRCPEWSAITRENTSIAYAKAISNVGQASQPVVCSKTDWKPKHFLLELDRDGKILTEFALTSRKPNHYIQTRMGGDRGHGDGNAVYLTLPVLCNRIAIFLASDAMSTNRRGAYPVLETI
jgi:hypothetical protein